MTPTKQQDEMWIEVLKWFGWNQHDNGHWYFKVTENQTLCLNSGQFPPPLTLDALYEAEQKFLATASLEQTSSWLDNLYRANGLNPYVWRNAYASGRNDPTPPIEMAKIVSSDSQKRLLALWRVIGQHL
jgi:hypothetical protein